MILKPSVMDYALQEVNKKLWEYINTKIFSKTLVEVKSQKLMPVFGLESEIYDHFANNERVLIIWLNLKEGKKELIRIFITRDILFENDPVIVIKSLLDNIINLIELKFSDKVDWLTTDLKLLD